MQSESSIELSSQLTLERPPKVSLAGETTFRSVAFCYPKDSGPTGGALRRWFNIRLMVRHRYYKTPLQVQFLHVTEKRKDALGEK